MARSKIWFRLLFAAAPFAILAGVGSTLPTSDDHGHGHDDKPAAKAPPKPADKHGDAKPAADDKHGHAASAPGEAKPKAKPSVLDDDHDDTSGASHRVDAPKPSKKEFGESGSGGPERAPKRGSAAAAETPTDADSALRALRDGNARWASDRSENPASNPSRRETLARDGQKPFASILTCADSRLPVERLFDRGVGDLFVVRVAGNIAGTSETGTLEYGVEHLHIPLLVVMGHTKCGAVAAATSHANPPGALGELVKRIGPAVERAEGQLEGATPEAVTAAAIKENVWQTIFDLLRHSPEIRTAIAKGELKVVGAVCDIGSGKVDFLGEHPWQNELVAAFNAREQNDKATASHEEEGH